MLMAAMNAGLAFDKFIVALLIPLTTPLLCSLMFCTIQVCMAVAGICMSYLPILLAVTGGYMLVVCGVGIIAMKDVRFWLVLDFVLAAYSTHFFWFHDELKAVGTGTFKSDGTVKDDYCEEAFANRWPYCVWLALAAIEPVLHFCRKFKQEYLEYCERQARRTLRGTRAKERKAAEQKAHSHQTITVTSRADVESAMEPPKSATAMTVIDAKSNTGNRSTPCSWLPSEETPSGGHYGNCVVCMAALAVYVCVPCGHMPACQSCMEGIQSSSQTCPICRQVIREAVRVYKH
jgi:hypothetical protein